jgi:hypothetical protein
MQIVGGGDVNRSFKKLKKTRDAKITDEPTYIKSIKHRQMHGIVGALWNIQHDFKSLL